MIKSPGRFRNIASGIPLLERLERFQAQELPELVHGARSPSSILLDRHHLDDLHGVGCTAGSEGACRDFHCALQDVAEFLVVEGSCSVGVGAFEAAECPFVGWGHPVDVLEEACDQALVVFRLDLGRRVSCMCEIRKVVRTSSQDFALGKSLPIAPSTHFSSA